MHAGTDRAPLEDVETLTEREARSWTSEAETLGAALFAPFRDAWIAARGRFALFSALGANAGGVTVESYRASVVLGGNVATRGLSEAAERAVRAVPGVVGVANRLRVGDVQPRPSTTDAEIRAALTARLRHARALRGSVIVVESVYDGVVRLTGAARDPEAIATAFTLAVEVRGVRRVINDVGLQSEDDLSGTADAA